MKMDPQEAASVSVAVASTVPSLAPPCGVRPSDFSSKISNSSDTAANLANNIRALKVGTSQYTEWILKKIAKAINVAFARLNCMLQGFRIYFVLNPSLKDIEFATKAV